MRKHLDDTSITTMTAFKLPVKMFLDLRQRADADGKSLSAFIRQALAEKIERETGEKIAA